MFGRQDVLTGEVEEVWSRFVVFHDRTQTTSEPSRQVVPLGPRRRLQFKDPLSNPLVQRSPDVNGTCDRAIAPVVTMRRMG